MGRPDLSLLSERRLRLANSSPDVKALFNAPAYIYNLEALEAASVSSTAGDDLGYGDGGGYGGTGEGQAAGGSVLGESDLDYWTPTSLVPIVSFHSFFFFANHQIDVIPSRPQPRPPHAAAKPTMPSNEARTRSSRRR
jgi:hypothetical protein